MKYHDRAWEGFRIAILGSKPLIPMQLEQAIATALPTMEVQISSFENYDQAYAFCKEQQDVGILFISDDLPGASFQSIFRELSELYKKSGLPAFGVITFEKQPLPFNEKAVAKHQQLLDYISTSSILESTKTASTIDNIWNQFVERFEKLVLPEALQISFKSSASAHIGSEAVAFLERLTTNIASELNISWLEDIAIKWAPILSTVKNVSPEFITPHRYLSHFIQISDIGIPTNRSDLLDLLGKDLPLTKKAFALTAFLEIARKSGNLASALNEISAGANNRSVKLVKHIAKNKDRILQFAHEAESSIGAFG